MTEPSAHFKQKYGPWALVCGASDGIGEAFAHQLAEAGINLVLMARRESLLVELAAKLSKQQGIEARPLAADLTSPDLMRQVEAATSGIEVGLLVYVSGAPSEHRQFLDVHPGVWINQVRLSCDGPVLLGHHFGAKMRVRGRGGMVFLSSLASRSGSSCQSVYTGVKAFDQLFAESLWHELAPHGVDVLCLMVGATNTPTTNDLLRLDFDAVFPGATGRMVMQSEDVAREGLENLANGPVWVAGEIYRAAFPDLAFDARAVAVEGASAILAKMLGLDDYTPVWDLETGKKIES